MEELHKYFTKRIVYLGVLVVLSALAIEKFLVPYIAGHFVENHALLVGLKYLTSKPSIVFIFTLGIYLIKEKLWKVEMRQYDFSGGWTGVTKFQDVVVGAKIQPFTTTYDINIQQDCLSIKILPSTGESFVNWGSLALDMPDRDTLRYAYWVIYTDRNRFPPKAIGYEEIKVTKRDERGRPIALTGVFYHCAQGQEPVYNGEIAFTKIDASK